MQDTLESAVDITSARVASSTAIAAHTSSSSSSRRRHCQRRSSPATMRTLLLGACLALAWSTQQALAQNATSPAPVTTAPPTLTPAPTTVAPTLTPAPTSAAPTPTATPAPSPHPTETPAPTLTPEPTATAAPSNGNLTDDAGVTDTPAPAATKKASKTPTPTPTPAPARVDDSDKSPIEIAAPVTKAPSRSKTPAPTDETSTKSIAEGDAKSRTIIIAVIAAVAALSVLGLMWCCYCRRRRRQSHDDLDDIVTPMAMHSMTHGAATVTHRQMQQQQQYHPSFSAAPDDRAVAQLADSKSQKPSLNTAGYAGLPTSDNGVPKYPITSPEMPATHRRTSAHQSRLADFSRRTRSGPAADAQAPDAPGYAWAAPPAPAQSNALRYTDTSDTSSFSIYGESDVSTNGSMLDRVSDASVFSSDIDESRRRAGLLDGGRRMPSSRGSFEL